MTPEELEAIRIADEVASPPPWLTADPGPYVHSVWESDGSTVATGMSPADARFICRARVAVPAMLAAIDCLRSMLIDAETEAQMQSSEVERLRAIMLNCSSCEEGAR